MVKIKNITNYLVVLLVVFALIIIYQIIKKVLGGSWQAEDIIIALLMFNLSAVFTLGIILAKSTSNQKYLSLRFNHLAKNFRKHVEKHKK